MPTTTAVAPAGAPRLRPHGLLYAREQAARRLQSLYRGWRVRKRVVWAVRAELDAFMAEMEAGVEMERLLLALPTPQTHAWHREDKGERTTSNASLRLPRIEDNVFGWCSSFPRETDAAVPLADTTAATHFTHDEARACREDVVADAVSLASSPSPSREDSDEQHEEPGDSNDRSTLPMPPHEEADIEERDMESPPREKVDEPDDAAVCPVQPVTVPPALCGKSGAHELSLTVEQILATHSKDEVLLELEWAKQALQDRLQYLRKRHRTTRS